MSACEFRNYRYTRKITGAKYFHNIIQLLAKEQLNRDWTRQTKLRNELNWADREIWHKK